MLLLSPDQAGDLILKGQNYKEIVDVQQIKSQYIEPPGYVKYSLTEEPIKIHDGCTRKRWIATFYKWRNHPQDGDLYRTPYSTSAVALSPKRHCSEAEFIYVNPGLTDLEALNILRAFQTILSKKTKSSFQCKNTADDNLCKNRKSILHGLKTNRIVLLQKAQNGVRVVLDTPTRFMIRVRFNPKDLGSISVEQDRPPPF